MTEPGDAFHDLLADLRAEHEVLDGLLVSLAPHRWRAPTPAAGWSVADTVAHLVVSERAAGASIRDGIDPMDGASIWPPDRTSLLEDWRAARTSTLDAFAASTSAERVPWGGRRMALRTLATARLMETWAHGLDCFAAAGRPPVDTVRLRHVAWLGWRTLPHAFAVARTSPPSPPERLRLDLTAPDGARWLIGPEDSGDTVRGSAGAWCRVVTHRVRDGEDADLVADGELARLALRHAQAFLDA